VAGAAKLRVVNWRCIAEAGVELRPVTVLTGRNAAGKSSLAHAAYLLTKAHDVGVIEVVERLYGGAEPEELGGVARVEGGRRVYPVVVEAGGYSVRINGPMDYVVPHGSGPPWKDGYLLPSTRVAAFKAFGKLARGLERWGLSDPKLALMVSDNWGPAARLFLEDLLRILSLGATGRYELPGGLGHVAVSVLPLSMPSVQYEDPHSGHRMALHLASDGVIDVALMEFFLRFAEEGSLLVVEEPEIHKSPPLLLDLAARVAEAAKGRNLTVVMTTHSELVPLGLAKMVEAGRLEPGDVAIYRLERGKDSPWARVRELKVYRDGTVEELPEVEEVVARLF